MVATREHGRPMLDVPSALWLDQPDAHAQIDAQYASKRVSAEEADMLRGFVENGYMKVALALDPVFCEALDDEISQLWQQRPADLAVSPLSGGPTSFADYDGPARSHGYRIPDLHSHSPHAMSLYLDSRLFRMIELVFREPAIAFQSLYFEYGSMQGLHRDPMFVKADPPLDLCASWIALEDITDDSGPLMYVPGSHRLPWFAFDGTGIVCSSQATAAERTDFKQWVDEAMHEHSLSVARLTCQRGDAFIWHGGLLHGGAPIDDPSRTRKSFVTHYSTASTYTSRTARMQVRENGNWKSTARTTELVIERDGARGLDGPLHIPVARSDKPHTSTQSPSTGSWLQTARRAKRWAARHIPRTKDSRQ